MDEKQAVLSALDALGVAYEVIDHPPVHTIEEMDALGLFTRGTVCKNLFLRNASGKTHYVVSMPKEKHPAIQTAIRQGLGSSRLSFGSDERLKTHLGLLPGAVSPFGVLNNSAHDVVVALDRDLKHETGLIGFHPNVNTSFVWLRFDGLMTFLKSTGNPVVFLDL